MKKYLKIILIIPIIIGCVPVKEKERFNLSKICDYGVEDYDSIIKYIKETYPVGSNPAKLENKLKKGGYERLVHGEWSKGYTLTMYNKKCTIRNKNINSWYFSYFVQKAKNKIDNIEFYLLFLDENFIKRNLPFKMLHSTADKVGLKLLKSLFTEHKTTKNEVLKEMEKSDMIMYNYDENSDVISYKYNAINPLGGELIMYAISMSKEKIVIFKFKNNILVDIKVK